MRLFIALPLNEEILNRISILEKEIDNKFGFRLNWISLKNLHLTILFLGYLNQNDYLKVEDIFNNFQKFKSVLDLKIKKVDYGAPGTKRMIWLYLEKNKELEEIKKYFENEIEKKKINYKREQRNFLPHINLIRLKHLKNLPEIKKQLNWQIHLNKICLFQSILKNEGAEYKNLKSINLDQHSP